MAYYPPTKTQTRTVEDGFQLPFSEKDELLGRLGDTVPDQPTIPLRNGAAVLDFIRGELSTARLGDLYKILFLVSRPNNISALHHQLVKGRRILVTEQADLHLVWYYESMLIKPVPKCLFSHSFWKQHLSPFKERTVGSKLHLEAQGFLRTYARLIVHESDLELAKELRLIGRDIQWDGWCHFIKGFGQLLDSQVAPRYHYGELRLTRLNFWTVFLLHGRSHLDVHHNYVTYFSRFGTPYLFAFGAVTVVLTALQTALQVYPQGTYRSLATVFVPFAVVSTMAGLASFPLRQPPHQRATPSTGHPFLKPSQPQPFNSNNNILTTT
ncbi:hypothetical protein DL771_010472 [Monosporascus sp. 5C6A]|nr:hypothetical protein DL771_010472 [Monosporascus sp. 5C6A]